MNLLQKWNSQRPARLRDPYQEMEGLTLLRSDGGKKQLASSEWMPLVDVTEDDKEYLIKAELPEVGKEDVKITVENGVLNIAGERKYEHEEKTKKHHRIERSYGRFVRSFALPDDASIARLSAEFKDGMLKVHLPKDQSAKPRTVEIKIT